MRVLAVNAGSSSLKLAAVDAGGATGAVLASRMLEAPGAAPDPGAVEAALAELGGVDAVGHRFVHGGPRLSAPVRVSAAVVAELRSLTELAPLHQPRSLAALEVVGRVAPALPAVACFDTAFHATLPAAASTYALPREWRERWGLRRFGFHGLSHAFASRRAVELAGGGSRVVTCHLGAGASLAAVRDGVCVDTTMGFTPLEGLVMATRAGSVDPGLLLWLLDERLPAPEVVDGLERRSGLRGLAGTADMREVLARTDDAARAALDVYVHRLRAGIAAMAASLGGLDVLAFTAGVGEHAPAVRAAAAAGLGFLGVALDAASNEAASVDAVIGAAGAAVATVVVTAREDVEIARGVEGCLER